MATSILSLLGGILVIYIVAHLARRAKLPPGPRGLPLLGNLHQAPKGAPWLTFTKWIKQYGSIVSVNLGGTIIIVGDYETAKELLDKRRNIYSSRPRLVMGHELVCDSNPIVFKPFGTDFLLHQKLQAPVLSPRATACYTPIQDLESQQLLKSLLGSSGSIAHCVEVFATSLAYSMAFGMRIHTGKEWQMERTRECMKNFHVAGQPGVWIVDALPWLNYLPAAIAPWKRQAAKWFHELDDLHVKSYNEALGREGWNWAKDFERAVEAQSMTEQQVAWDVGILADAGVETMSATLMIFVLACVAHPEWLAKAQKEIDQVVGERLPGFGDLKDLPYIQAVVEEVFRWRHPQQAGIPHATTHEDYYQGYLIPKGSVVIPVFSAMRHNEDLFDKPAEFRPERWMGKSQSQFNNFGYGRRICPGRHIARNSASIVVARLLWAFNIRTPSGEKLVVEESMFTTGFVSAPKPFACIFEPRSETHVRVIQESFDKVDKNLTSLLNEAHEKHNAMGIKARA
ncbi:unnamed protein product [Alternaria alternata]